MPYPAAIFDILTRLLNWAAACFVLLLMYTLLQESFVDKSEMTIGEMKTSKTLYRYQITFENQSVPWDNETIQRNESFHHTSSDDIAGILNTSGRAYWLDGVHFSNTDRKRQPVHSATLRGRSRVPGDAPLPPPNLNKYENKSSFKSLNDSTSTPDNRKFTSSQFLARTRGDMSNNPRLIDSNFYKGNFSPIKEDLIEQNNNYVYAENEGQSKDSFADHAKRFEVGAQFPSAEEAARSKKYDSEADTPSSSKPLRTNVIGFDQGTHFDDRIDPASKKNSIRNTSEVNGKKVMRRVLAETAVAKFAGSEEHGEHSDETEKAHLNYTELLKEEKFESQVKNTAQESPSKMLLSAPIAKGNEDVKKMIKKLLNKTSTINGKQLSFIPWILREPKAATSQADGGQSTRVSGNDLENTQCTDDANCTLFNFDLVPHATSALVRPAFCDQSGMCTCGNFCVSASRLYPESTVAYYCGPCGRVGSSCGSDQECYQTNVYCRDSYCSCSQGDFYDLYYCIFNFTGYEKALQVAISICIAVAIFLLLVTMWGARQRARGGTELSPYLMRLLLRRANEGTRESPAGDVPPSYEEVLTSDRDQLPSYEDAMKASAEPLDDLPEGEVNYGFHLTEEDGNSTENIAMKDFTVNQLLTAPAPQLLSSWDVENIDDSPPDVRIRISEVDAIFENDEFDQMYDLCTTGEGVKGLNDSGAVLKTRYRHVGAEGQERPKQIGTDVDCESRRAHADNPAVIYDGVTNSEYVEMDPSTGAIPKQRSRQKLEYLNKMKRGSNRNQRKNKDVQNELTLIDFSCHPLSKVNLGSDELDENNSVKSDILLDYQAGKSQNSSSLESYTLTPTEGPETNNENIGELTTQATNA